MSDLYKLRVVTPACDIDFVWPAVYEAILPYRGPGMVPLCRNCWRVYTDQQPSSTNRELTVTLSGPHAADIKVFTAKDILKCPIKSMAIRHYREDGSCLCVAEPAKS